MSTDVTPVPEFRISAPIRWPTESAASMATSDQSASPWNQMLG